MITALTLAAALVAAPAGVLDGCVAEAESFRWGFKESFRAYISGSIANGEWSTEGDIEYETPAFFSDELTGAVQLDEFGGRLAVDGAMRFTGHEGILDTTIGELRFVVESAERVVVVADVRGTTQDFVPIDSVDVPFLTGDLSLAEWSASDEGGLFIDGIPLALTAEGAEAFGTYPEGEPFDSLSLELSTTPDCAAWAIVPRSTAMAGLPLLAVAGVVAGVVGLGAVLFALLRRRAAA